MARISERHEVRVEASGHRYLFIAEEGRLSIRQETEGGRELCSLTVARPDELSAFFDGLRRVLESTHADERPRRKQDERDQMIQQAQRRNAKAFAPWTPDEDRRVRELYERGKSIDEIARLHNRSPRAIEMRLGKLGVLGYHPSQP